MKMTSLLIAVLLAVTLVALAGSTIVGPNFNMFKAPRLSLGNLGFQQISPSEIGTTPLLFAPTGQQLLHGGGLDAHFMPRLGTGNWTSSMKNSQVNQMFAVMARGIGNNNIA